MSSFAPAAEPAPAAQAHSSSTRTVAVVFAGFSAFLALYAPQPLLPDLAGAFHVSAASISLIMTASTLAVALAAPFAGVISDRIGRKRVIVPAALLLAIPTALCAISNGLGQLMFWRFWQGIFTPGIFAVTIAYINEEWEEGVGAAMSAYVSGTVLGGFTGRMLTAFLASHLGWRWSFLALAVLEAASGAVMWLWLPRERHARRHEGSMFHSMRMHLRNRRLIATYAVGFCVLFTLIATFTYVNFYLAAPPFRLSTAWLGLVFSVYLVGAAVTPVAGRAIDRLGHRLALATAFGGGVLGICLTLSSSLPLVLAGLALTCTGVFIAQAAASSYIGSIVEQARAAAVGLYVMFYYIGGSFGSALPGRFWASGGWPACVLAIALIQMVTIALAIVFWKPQRPSGHDSELPV